MPAFNLAETVHYKPDPLTMWRSFDDMKILADHEEEFGSPTIAHIIRQIVKWERRPQSGAVPSPYPSPYPSSSEVQPIFSWRHNHRLGWYFPYYLPKSLFDGLDKIGIFSVVVVHLDPSYRSYVSLNGAYSALIESVMLNTNSLTPEDDYLFSIKALN